ncbi:MAG: hypothetical protein R3F59_38705 [Myxococcota bacterium]
MAADEVAAVVLERAGVEVAELAPLGHVTHVFTHRRLVCAVWTGRARRAGGRSRTTRRSPGRIRAALPLSTLTRHARSRWRRALAPPLPPGRDKGPPRRRDVRAIPRRWRRWWLRAGAGRRGLERLALAGLQGQVRAMEEQLAARPAPEPAPSALPDLLSAPPEPRPAAPARRRRPAQEPRHRRSRGVGPGILDRIDAKVERLQQERADLRHAQEQVVARFAAEEGLGPSTRDRLVEELEQRGEAFEGVREGVRSGRLTLADARVELDEARQRSGAVLESLLGIQAARRLEDELVAERGAAIAP